MTRIIQRALAVAQASLSGRSVPVVLSVALLYFTSVALAWAYVSCDGSHIHADWGAGKWFGCSGVAWRSGTDANRIYMKSSWSAADAKYARDVLQNSRGMCIEMQCHYNGNRMGTITWASNSASACLDYDGGDYNIDIHVPAFGSVAYNSGYVQNWVRCGRSDIIGTSYVYQHHISASGRYCLDATWCALGATRSNTDGRLTDRPREWYSSWSNGARH